MKKAKLILLILLTWIVNAANTAISQASNITYVHNQSFAADIVIDEGEWYHFTGNIQLINNSKIHIKDGGRMTAESAVFSSGAVTVPDWGGIQIDPTEALDPTPFTALEFNNVILEDAQVAFELSGRDVSASNYTGNFPSGTGLINRGILVRNSEIRDCKRFVQLNNKSSIAAMSNYWSVVFDNTDFHSTVNLKSSDTNWPIWMKYGSNVKFIECDFEYKSDIMLHFRTINSLSIKACTFKFELMPYNSSGYTYSFIETHGFGVDGFVNMVIEDNTFNYHSIGSSHPMFRPQYAISDEKMPGTTMNGVIRGNKFIGGQSTSEQYGVYFRTTATTGLLLEENEFKYLDKGVQIRDAEDAIITSNDFFGCSRGIIFGGTSSSATINCNTFEETSTGIYVSSNNSLDINNLGTTGGFNNKYINVDVPIINNSTSTIIYRLDPTTPNEIVPQDCIGPIDFDYYTFSDNCLQMHNMLSGKIMLGGINDCYSPTPLEGIVITVVDEVTDYKYYTVSESDGTYELFLPSAVYTISANALSITDFVETTCSAGEYSSVSNNTPQTNLDFIFYKETTSGGGGGGAESSNPSGDGFNSIQNLDLDIKVAPNPANSILTVEINSDKELFSLQIVDARGVRVIDMKTNNKQEVIDVSELSSGMYFLMVTNGTNFTSKKLQIIE